MPHTLSIFRKNSRLIGKFGVKSANTVGKFKHFPFRLIGNSFFFRKTLSFSAEKGEAGKDRKMVFYFPLKIGKTKKGFHFFENDSLSLIF